MKRTVGMLVVAAAAAATAAMPAAPASADAGGYCNAYIDVNCWHDGEQCDLWWNYRCYIDVT